MRIEQLSDPDMIVVYDTFTDEELRRIWKEIDFLTEPEYLFPPEQTGAATDENGTPKKANAARFLDKFYGDNLWSPLFVFSEKLLTPDIAAAWKNIDPMHAFFEKTNCRSVLLSYYENSSYYDAHEDASFYTITTYLYKEPRMFQGGNITFCGSRTLPPTHNMSVIFPSFYLHEVSPITMEDSNFSGNGRYCISQFLGHRV